MAESGGTCCGERVASEYIRAAELIRNEHIGHCHSDPVQLGHALMLFDEMSAARILENRKDGE